MRARREGRAAPRSPMRRLSALRAAPAAARAVDMARAVDCFVVCGLPAIPTTVAGNARGFVGAGETYRPEVLSSYPPRRVAPDATRANNDDASGSRPAVAPSRDATDARAPWPPELALMSMPDGVDVHIADPPPHALAPRAYPLVLTDGVGALVYVACLSFLEPVPEAARVAHPALRSACARKCICLASRAPIVPVLQAALRAIHRACFLRARRDAPPIADVVAALVDGLTLPPPGSPPVLFTVCGRPLLLPVLEPSSTADGFSRPGFSSSFVGWDSSSGSDAIFEPLLRALDERNAARAACAVLTERRVLLRSRQRTLLVSAATALVESLRPMRWRHVFVPLLPAALASYVEAPTPYLMGVHADVNLPPEATRGVVVVDLDANDVRGFSESDKPPRDVVDPLAANLRRLVAPELVRMDERGERGRAADRGSDRGGGGASSIAGRDHGRGHGHGHGSSPGRGPGSAPAVSSSWSPFARRRRDSGGDKAVSRFESSSIDADTNRRVSASHATSFDAAARASARGKRWSPAHDDAAREAFLAAWRRCFRGYRRHLLPSIPRDGSPCFSADGFYDWCVEANRVRRDVAAFVRTVAGSSAFLAHAESQIRAANDAEERRRAKDENAAREGNSLGGGDGAASAVAALVFGPRDGRLSSDGDVGNRDSRHRDSDADPDPDRDAPPPDPLLETDHDEETMGWGNAAMGARRLRAGAVVRAVRFGSHVRRGGGDDGGESVPIRFRTTQATDVGVGVGVGSDLGVGVGFTPAVASAGPSAHAAALGSRFGAPPPLPPPHPFARFPSVEPPAVKGGGDDTGGGGSAHLTLEGLENVHVSPTEPWISAAGASARRMEEPGASSPSPPSSVRTVRRSASLSSERGRATELRSSPKARFGSDDSGASDADSNPRGERNWRPASPSGTVTDEETPRSEEEPVRRPRPSRASSLKGAASMSLWSSGASLFRSRRKSEATKLKREATRQKRRDDRFFGSSVGSAAEMNALVERSTSVSAFDGWLAAADVADPPKAALDEKTPTAPSLGGKPSNGGAGTASASTVHRRSESQAKKQVRSDAERDDVPSDRPRPSEISSTARRRLAANRDGSGAESSDGGGSEGVPTRVPTRVPPGNARDARDSFREYGNAHHELERRTRELWSLASAGAAMRARATTAAAAIRALPSPFSPGRGGQAAATATAATLVAVDFDGVLFALEGGGAAIPIARAGLVSLAEEERPRGSGLDRPREESDAAAEAEINAARAKEAAEVTACPGAPAVLHALAAVAAAKSDARALVRILATVRVPGSSSSFLEESDAGVAADAVSERFDPASAAANGDVGRVLCRLPGGSALWGDPRVWRGLDPLLDPPRSGVFGGPAGSGTLGASGSVGLTGSPGSPGSPGSSRRRRRALAAAMASVGLPAHAVASLLARLGLEETATRAPPLPGDSPDAGNGPAPRSSGEMNRFSGRRTGAKTASGGLGSGRTGTGSRVGRSIARVWDVTTTAPPETLVAVAVGSGPGVAVSHDCWIESLRDVVAETAAPTFAARAAADAPRWALDERTRGADRLPFRTVFSSDDELDSSDREDSDEDSDPYAIRHRSRRVRRGGFVGGAARLPADAASARVFSSPATVVATQLGGGAVAAGSANGGFAVWRPDTGVVTRAAAGGWGEGGAGDDNAVTFTADGAAFTALGFLTESAESAPAGDDPPRPGLVVGGTRGGGVAAWDAATGACVLAAPGSHAGVVTFARAAGIAAPGSPPPGPSAGAATGPSLALTASSAPNDGSVRLWDVRQGPREAAAALTGHAGGVTAMSRVGVSGAGALFVGDGSGIVRAWDWRRAGAGALASAGAHAGAVLSVAPLSLARSDVAASAGVDGTVRVLSLDGGDGGGARLRGHLGPVVGVAADAGFSSVAGLRESIDVAGGKRAGADARGARHRKGFSITGLRDGIAAGGDAGEGSDVAIASGGVDGVVRVWRGPSPGVGAGAGDATGARDNRGWRCVGAAKAHGAALAAVELAPRGVHGARLVTAAWDTSVALWPAPASVCGVGGAAGASEGTGGTGPATGAVHEKKSDAKSDGARPTSPSHGPDSRGNVVGYAGGRGAPRARGWSGVGWTPTTMHRRVGDASARAIALDHAGGRLVTGERDGTITCARVPTPAGGW